MLKQSMSQGLSKIIVIFTLVLFTILNCCSSKNEREDIILVHVKIFDKKIEKPRSNDTIVVRVVKKPLFNMRQYKAIEKKVTNNSGFISIELNKWKRYSFNVYGSDGNFTFDELEINNLKKGDTIFISMDSSKNKLQWKRE